MKSREERKSCVGAKTKTGVKGSKWNAGVKIVKDGRTRCRVGGERFSEGFSRAAIREGGNYRSRERNKGMKGKGQR